MSLKSSEQGLPIAAAFALLSEQYQSRKAVAEKAVREWRWATFSWFDPRPLYFERKCLVPGRPLPHKPKDPNGCAHYGFDERERVVVARRHNEIAYYETFYNWEGERAESAHYDYFPSKAPLNLIWYYTHGEMVVASEMATKYNLTRETYLREGDQVTRVLVERAEREDGDAGGYGDLIHYQTATVDYDDRGLVSRVTLRWPPDPPNNEQKETVETVFERRGKRIWRKPP